MWLSNKWYFIDSQWFEIDKIEQRILCKTLWVRDGSPLCSLVKYIGTWYKFLLLFWPSTQCFCRWKITCLLIISTTPNTKTTINCCLVTLCGRYIYIYPLNKSMVFSPYEAILNHSRFALHACILRMRINIYMQPG